MSDFTQDVQPDLSQKETNHKSLTPSAQGTQMLLEVQVVSEQSYKEEEKYNFPCAAAAGSTARDLPVRDLPAQPQKPQMRLS